LYDGPKEIRIAVRVRVRVKIGIEMSSIANGFLYCYSSGRFS